MCTAIDLRSRKYVLICFKTVFPERDLLAPNLQRKMWNMSIRMFFLCVFWQLHLFARPFCQSADKHFAGKEKKNDSCRKDKSRFNHRKCLQNKQLQMVTDDKSRLEEAAQPRGRAPSNGQCGDSSRVLRGTNSEKVPTSKYLTEPSRMIKVCCGEVKHRGKKWRRGNKFNNTQFSSAALWQWRKQELIKQWGEHFFPPRF